jgi:superfamily II DNA or RNA helicase
MLDLRAPTVIRLDGLDHQEALIRKELTFLDKKVDWTYRKFKNSKWHRQSLGEDAYNAQLQALAVDRHRCLLFRDDRGFWTYSGLRPLFEQQFGFSAKRSYVLPAPQPVPYAHLPTKTSRYYQTDAEEALMAAAEFGPAGVEIGTGLGKSFIIVKLLKRLGLPAVVMSPSVNIAEQIYDELVFHFGKSRVGFFGDGKKEFKKLFTVAVGQSLRRVEEGSPAWNAFSNAKVFIADESHMCPAETLQQVCFGLCAGAGYRFFFSGTQMRGDGLDLLLDAITGPIVYRMSVREGIDQGFLAKVNFRMLWLDSNVRDKDKNLIDLADANDMNRAHLLYNDDVNRRAAEMANKSVSLVERPTVILIDEYEQLGELIPYLRYVFKFAHGPLDKKTKLLVPKEYWNSEPKKLVEEFNRGEFPILIGTSCIATGTDIQRVKTLINLRFGKSEVEIRQAVGRCTRKVPDKEDCTYIDFGIRNVEILEKHANARKKLYQEIYPSYQEIQL